MNYLNPYRIEDFNASIVEWDIRSANVSLCREYGLLPEKQIDLISNMHKSKRERTIGLIMQKDKDFCKALESKFDEVMKIFIEQNDLDIDWDIISIKKDAAFIINKDIKKPVVGNYVTFRPKGIYSHHLYIKPLDIYINNDTIDVKGINDDLLPRHSNGILNLIRVVCNCMGSSNPKKEVNELLSDFVELYKKRELDLDYYREFNVNSQYRLSLFGNEVLMDSITEDLLENVDISYNYEKFILPLIRIIR